MGKILDITGQRFGRWTVIERAGKNEGGSILWFCVCDCGKTAKQQGGVLKFGSTRSCGCAGSSLTTHRMTNTRLYSIWGSMRERCYRKKHMAYKSYGGRGIAIEWKNFIEFANDMKESYDKHVAEFGERQTTIDRIDNNANYCKSNCRWVTYKENSQNTSRSVKLTFAGETLNLTTWAERLGVHSSSLSRAIKRGKSIEDVILQKNVRLAPI